MEVADVDGLTDRAALDVLVRDGQAFVHTARLPFSMTDQNIALATDNPLLSALGGSLGALPLGNTAKTDDVFGVHSIERSFGGTIDGALDVSADAGVLNAWLPVEMRLAGPDEVSVGSTVSLQPSMVLDDSAMIWGRSIGFSAAIEVTLSNVSAGFELISDPSVSSLLPSAINTTLLSEAIDMSAEPFAGRKLSAMFPAGVDTRTGCNESDDEAQLECVAATQWSDRLAFDNAYLLGELGEHHGALEQAAWVNDYLLVSTANDKRTYETTSSLGQLLPVLVEPPALAFEMPGGAGEIELDWSFVDSGVDVAVDTRIVYTVEIEGLNAEASFLEVPTAPSQRIAIEPTHPGTWELDDPFVDIAISDSATSLHEDVWAISDELGTVSVRVDLQVSDALPRATDPSDRDSDNDGVCDANDRCEGNDSDGDSDGDGLCDGRDPCPWGLDLTTDVDNDGLCNVQEVTLGTDPQDADTDDDGLSDGSELSHGTNPFTADSDGGGYDDGLEVATGHDPTDPQDDWLSMWVTSEAVTGDIGLAGAAALCQAEAETLGASHAVPWLSMEPQWSAGTDEVPPVQLSYRQHALDRIEPGPYANVRGERLLDAGQDVTTLIPRVSKAGGKAFDGVVWSGAGADGYAGLGSCSGWTSGASNHSGKTSNLGQSNWNESFTSDCHVPRPLVCFEVGPDDLLTHPR